MVVTQSEYDWHPRLHLEEVCMVRYKYDYHLE
jgi:hypothetical protein